MNKEPYFTILKSKTKHFQPKPRLKTFNDIYLSDTARKETASDSGLHMLIAAKEITNYINF